MWIDHFFSSRTHALAVVEQALYLVVVIQEQKLSQLLRLKTKNKYEELMEELEKGFKDPSEVVDVLRA